MEQVPTKHKKTRQTKPQTPKSDFFTLLCKSDLKLDCIKEHKFHPVRRWRFDYAIPTAKIAIEVEGGVWTGGRHTSPKGFLNDMEKYNTATIMGWRLLRTTPDRLCSNETLQMVRDIIAGDQSGQQSTNCNQK